jgi:uncharacterized membrane protein YdjX (TVP38/TMEM64 family)
LVLIGIAFFFRARINAALLVDWIQSLGPWAPLVFMLIFLVAPALFIPGAPITIAGGALFGPVWGTVYSIVAATGGAAIAFQISRHLAGDWVERNSGGIVKRLKDGVEEEGWRFVAFTRLVPLFPFNVLNYGFGMTRVKFSHYVVASFLCMIPGAAAYSFIGYAGREAVLGGKWPLLKIGAALGLILFLSMIPRFMFRLKKPEKNRS